MRTVRVKLGLIALLSLTLLGINLPVLAVGETLMSPASRPVETVAAKSGRWHSEVWSHEGRDQLMTGYTGNFAGDTVLSEPGTFRVSEPMQMTSIQMPFKETVSEGVRVSLVEESGTVVGTFDARPERISEDSGETIYTVQSPGETLLSPGEYRMEVTGSDRQVTTASGDPAFLVKGVRQEALDRVPEEAGDPVEQGTPPEEFSAEIRDLEEYMPGLLMLEADYLVETIVLNTWNGGDGAEPGLVAILDEEGNPVDVLQAVGMESAGVPNAVWEAYPMLVLPAGLYQIVVEDPSILQYDEDGDPQFYVSLLPPPETRTDFTGTYRINLSAMKTSTLMGPANDTMPSFSLKDFEISVLDKGETIEVVGKYEGVPFSQECIVVETQPDFLKAEFVFGAEVPGVGAATSIGAEGAVMLRKSGSGANFAIAGAATYQREATADEGADFNTYDVTANGAMTSRDLPPFVMTALGKTGSAGNVPGPDNAAQSATGLLFPPLVGLVVSVVQDALREREAAKAAARAAARAKEAAKGPKKYSKEWYKKQYPGKTDEQLAMIMLADAMGNTDEPDDDPESMSTGDSGRDSGDAGYEPPEYEPEEEPEYEAEPEPEPEPEPERPKPEEPVEEARPEPEPELPPEPQEPETMEIQTDHTGRTTEYVKDPETGEWVNPQTGGVLDMEVYEKVVKPGFERDREFIEREWEKNVKGETAFDKQLRADEARRQEQLAHEEKVNKLRRKYGIEDEDEIWNHIAAQQERDYEAAESWNKYADKLQVAEDVATTVQTGADLAIDGLANATGPAGRTIRAVYKVTKGVAGTTADKGINTRSVVSGLISGGADAAGDFIDNPIKKAGMAVAGETLAEYTKTGKQEDAQKGFVTGVYKAGMGFIGDKILPKGYGNDAVTTNLKSGQVRVAVKSGEKWAGRVLSSDSANKFIQNKLVQQGKQTLAKAVLGEVDNRLVKPTVLDPVNQTISDNFASARK